MGAESWVAFILALLVALAVPGPDLVLVVHSATRGVREGVSTAAGIVSGLMLHALLAIIGATALLLSAPGALIVVQLLGAGVLLWMGIGLLLATRSRSQEPDATNETMRRSRGGYARGFVTNATNPKALLFFAAILPQFIGRGDGVETRTVMLCATVILGAGLWWAAAITLVRLFSFHRSSAADRAVTLLGGLALLVIGVELLTTTGIELIRPGA